METITLITTKINNAQVDLVLRAFDAQLVRRPAAHGGDVCVADSGAIAVLPTQPRFSYDLCPGVVPAPISHNRIENLVKGHRVNAGTARQMSARGKAATKFSTRLGRRTCSPPV